MANQRRLEVESINGFDYYSWDEIDEAIDAFVEFCKKKGLKFSGVYGIPRGGQIPAICLSHRLDCHFWAPPQKAHLLWMISQIKGKP